MFVQLVVHIFKWIFMKVQDLQEAQQRVTCCRTIRLIPKCHFTQICLAVSGSATAVELLTESTAGFLTITCPQSYRLTNHASTSSPFRLIQTPAGQQTRARGVSSHSGYLRRGSLSSGAVDCDIRGQETARGGRKVKVLPIFFFLFHNKGYFPKHDKRLRQTLSRISLLKESVIKF